MFRLAIIVGLVAVCVAKTPIEHCCSAEDRAIVETQWKTLWKNTESSKLKIVFGRKILLKVIELNPEVKDLFKNVNVDDPLSGEFSAHSMRILNAIDMVINLLDDADAVDEALDHLADQHEIRAGVKKVYFKTFGEVLAKGLYKVLDDYDSMAWKSCFRTILTKIAGKLQA
jgi:hemoglobin-like flavoprotein